MHVKKNTDLKNSHKMILESINIGSRGDIFTAGKDIICTLIRSLVSAALESDRREYERKRAELELEIRSNQLFMQKREDIFKLIAILALLTKEKPEVFHQSMVQSTAMRHAIDR